ncbi:MAG: hypothetical protein RL592_582 [Verrucomicrobiota bacterium]
MRHLLLALLATCALRAAEPIVSCDYADDAAAAKAWRAVEGSPTARIGQDDIAHVLRLDCNFSTNKRARTYWDHKVDLDLSTSEGIRLEVRCRDRAPIAQFHVYFEAQGGWYNASFTPQRTSEWTTVEIRKDAAKTEGNPAGWKQIKTIRIAAYRAEDKDAYFEIRSLRKLGQLGDDTHVLLLKTPDAKERFDERLSRQLSARGLRHASITEAELSPATLDKTELLILPNHTRLTDEATTAIEGYLRNNGRLLAFYSLPPRLLAAAGIGAGKHLLADPKGRFASIRPVDASLVGAPAITGQASWNIIAHQPVAGRSRTVAEWFDDAGKPSGFPAIIASDNTVLMTHVLLDDDKENKSQLLLAMAGLLRPAIWHDSIAVKLRRLDELGEFKDFAAACAFVRSRPGATPMALARLDAAIAARADALAQEKAGHFTQSLASADQAMRLFQEAYCLAHPAKPGEFRAVWCHSAYGVKNRTWDDAILNLKNNGFTAIFPNMLWGGVAYYPSTVLPVAPDIATKGDQIAECLAACRKHGLQIHVWKVDWNLGRDVPKAFVEKLRSEHRLQMSDTGEEEPWLCPSNPLNAALERDALVEVARNYAVDGIHFDYIRYPDGRHCFCPPCRVRFEQATGSPVARWPADVQPKGVRREAWIKWCQENINTVVRTTSEEVRKVRPGIKVSAAVFRQWDQDSRVVMQDWKLWCAQGWLDFVCPMDYTESETGYDSWIRQQKQWAGPAGLVPGIGITSSRTTLAPDAAVRQIEITRRHETQGFILFNYGEREAREIIPTLGLGPTRR